MKRPTGYTLLGLYLGWKALAGFLLVLGIGLEPLPDSPPTGLSMLVSVFAGVAAEALWRCRPWVARAYVAYVCAAILAPLAASAADGHLGIEEAVFTAIGYLMIAALPMWYVSNRAVRMFAPPAPRAPVGVRVPAPHP